MDRLTKRLGDGQAVMDCGACGVSWHKKHEKDMPYCTALHCRNRLKDRLAAYEDTGLEPEQILELKSFTQGGVHKADEGWLHVQALLQAEKDGLIPPCKRGDVVYCIRHNPRTGYRVKPLNVCTVTVWGPGHFTIFTTKEDTLGKTVFLTREEAEAALKGGTHETDPV